MIEIKKDEGLMEYIRRHEKIEKEISTVSGIPANLMGDIKKSRPTGVADLMIFGCIEFIEKFKKGIENVTLRKK